MNSRKTLVTALIAMPLLSAALVASAQQPPKPEQLIKWRQSAFQVLGWNSARIKNNVEGQYNKEEVIKAANTIAAIANSGLGGLFPAGTETGKGWHETSTKPEFFKDTKKVAELAAEFSRESSELAKVAATGDVAAVKAQFGRVTRNCKACHDDFKTKD